MRSRLRVALFSSPAFGLPLLARLADEHELVLVVTQPDRRAGRGMKLRAPAVAARARETGLPLAQPARLGKDEDAPFAQRLQEADLDVAVTAAYGKILPAALLTIPRHGFLNAHASLLPAYRGAAPIQWALIHGERETGISVMQTEAGLDTGPVRHVVRTDIGPRETAPMLFERCAQLAADAVSEALALLAADRLPCVPQDHAAATAAPLLTREDGRIRWHESARAGYDRWRGVLAWPGSWFPHAGGAVRVDELTVLPRDPSQPPATAPGTILAATPAGVDVACGDHDALRLLRVTPAGRRTMPAYDWIVGSDLREGGRLA